MTISNTGQADLSIEALSLAGSNPKDFVVTSNGCLGSISPGASCQLTRGRRTYATGVGSQLEGATTELVLRELRPVRRGRYTLTMHRHRMIVTVVS